MVKRPEGSPLVGPFAENSAGTSRDWLRRAFSAFDSQRELNVSARRMAVWADFLMRFFDQRECFFLRQRWNRDFHRDCNTKAPSFTRPHGSVAADYGSLHVLLVLPGHEFDSAAEAGCVPSRKQVLWRGGVAERDLYPWPTAGMICPISMALLDGIS